MLDFDIIFWVNFLGSGSVGFLDVFEDRLKARVKELLERRRKLWGFVKSLVLAAEAEVRLERAPGSREEERGCCFRPVMRPF